MTTVRAGAALAMLASAAAIYGVSASAAFDSTQLVVAGARYTDQSAVEAVIADVRGQNLFGLVTRPLQVSLESLPTVAAARVDVRLPSTLAVTLDERVPVLIWQVGARRYLADRGGTLFAMLSDKTLVGAAGLPVVDDGRATSAGLSIGLRIDPVDVDAATRLASLVPADVGSKADSLTVQISDESGFVLRAKPRGWLAIFGFYTPSLRMTEIIPGQVRLLRSLLVGREPLIERVILASETDGTYVARPTPTPGASPKPSKSP